MSRRRSRAEQEAWAEATGIRLTPASAAPTAQLPTPTTEQPAPAPTIADAATTDANMDMSEMQAAEAAVENGPSCGNPICEDAGRCYYPAETAAKEAIEKAKAKPVAADTVTLFRTSIPVTKRWTADGSVKPGKADANGKPVHPLWGKAEVIPVGSIEGLYRFLAHIETNAHACALRYAPVEDWREIQADNLPRWNAERERNGQKATQQRKPDHVMRKGALFQDVPHHWQMLDVDNFPLEPDETVDEAIERYIRRLPEEFHNASYIRQLSASAGHPTKAGILKVHLWFWNEEKLDSATLKAWGSWINASEESQGQDKLVDTSVFSTVQVHYTARPLLDPDVVDPIKHRLMLVTKGGNLRLAVNALMHKAAERTRKKSAREYDDPRLRQDWVGALHRAITVEELVERFMPDEFETSPDGRWTWRYSDGGAREGVFIREDGNALGANHNSWPGGPNKTHRFVDLLREFGTFERDGETVKFKDLDRDSSGEACPFDEMNPRGSRSFDAVKAFVRALPEVQAELANPSIELPSDEDDGADATAQTVAPPRKSADEIIEELRRLPGDQVKGAWVEAALPLSPDEAHQVIEEVSRLIRIGVRPLQQALKQRKEDIDREERRQAARELSSSLVYEIH